MVSRCRLAAWAGGDALAIAVLMPDRAALVAGLSDPHHWVEVAGADGVAVRLTTAALWVVAVWLGIGLAATIGGALPGTAGRLARTLARRLLPALIWRAVAGAAGLTVLAAQVGPLSPAAAAPTAAAPTAAAPTAAAPTAAAPTAAAAAAPALPASPPATASPTWPTFPSQAQPATESPSQPTTRLPRPAQVGWPTSTPRAEPPAGRPAPPTSPTTGGRPRGSVPPATPPASAHPPTVTRPPTEPAPDNTVTVHPGDSLWLIAARRLGPSAGDAEIAVAWPAWYAANRDQIGGDPGLLRPGQVLHEPAGLSTPPNPTPGVPR